VCHALLGDAKLYVHLLRIDRDLAAAERAGGCPACGGRLDVADYLRKPRGGPAVLPAEYERRFSFCCDACRRRVTPPSVRFFGRRVYLAPVFLLVSAMQGALTARRLARLHDLFGVDRRTVIRWRQWWRESFPMTAFFRAMAGRFIPAMAIARLAGALLARFSGSTRDRVIAVLRFLSPLSTHSARAR
jgi:hypothetical protein